MGAIEATKPKDKFVTHGSKGLEQHQCCPVVPILIPELRLEGWVKVCKMSN